MVTAPNLLHPRRSAHASIRGYLYQACLGVERWLDLADGEALLCEGDEDLDRLVQAVLDASSRREVAQRLLTPADLGALLTETAQQLSRWAGTAPARALRRSFDEVAELGKLLEEGTRELPELGEPRKLPPGKLLTAAYEVIPFTLREAELEEIAEWCDTPQSESVWLWTGEGGMGKTRFAIEACARLRHAGWVTGFLHTEVSAENLERPLEGHLPRLVVVDYAETRLGQVRPLLRRLARRPKRRAVCSLPSSSKFRERSLLGWRQWWAITSALPRKSVAKPIWKCWHRSKKPFRHSRQQTSPRTDPPSPPQLHPPLRLPRHAEHLHRASLRRGSAEDRGPTRSVAS